jgi:hypothetical protein
MKINNIKVTWWMDGWMKSWVKLFIMNKKLLDKWKFEIVQSILKKKNPNTKDENMKRLGDTFKAWFQFLSLPPKREKNSSNCWGEKNHPCSISSSCHLVPLLALMFCMINFFIKKDIEHK